MPINLRVVSPPSVEPVSLAEARLWVRVDTTDDDSIITDLVGAAREYCEGSIGHAFIQQTLEYAIPSFPLDAYCIELPMATPLRSVGSVKYTEIGGNVVTWDPSKYIVDTANVPGRIVLPFGSWWPITVLENGNSVVIQYDAGADSVSPAVPFPRTLKVAMRLLVEHWYANRSATVGRREIPEQIALGVADLLGVNQQLYGF